MNLKNKANTLAKTNVTIVGGGSSTHALIPFLTSSSREINLLTSKPEEWESSIILEYRNENNDVLQEFNGQLDNVSDLPIDVIPKSDIIILCMPVYKYREALDNIASYLSPNTVIGTIYGQGAFNFMVNEIKNKYDLINITTFAIGLIPWICRIEKYGKIGITYGAKNLNIVAFDHKNKFSELEEFFNDICFKWFKKGKFKLSENFISLTLSVDNQIIHTSRLYGLYIKSQGIWNNESDVPYFYKDYDDLSATLLKELDSDYSLIREAIKSLYSKNNYDFMLDYLQLEQLTYNSSNKNIKESFVNSETLGAIKTPVIKQNNQYIINKNHRFFYDDIYYGLCIAKWIAEKLDLNVKTIDEILYWSQDILHDKIIKDNKLVENVKSGAFNIYSCFTIDEIIK
ncbi:MAG: NAD/NADP octopine/nopaline dehydrogenase family protein [Campylobacterota bacterium]|nr:NAD/NADP octopine/nopaline dehydrogenase family protein [Campylobacterota bacterium]